jgi:GNAT superfamily N-acetyltransferase
MKRVGDHAGFSIWLATSRDRGFYALVGPLAMRRDVVKELEGAVLDGPGHAWLVARDGERVVAFSSWRDTGRGVAWFNQTWVDPEYRRRGIYRALFGLKERLAVEAGAAVLKGTALAHSKGVFEERGWVVTSTRGPRWTWYEKRLS